MIKKAEEIGLKNTHFVTPHGLDDNDHYTTAYELALITDYALENPKFAQIVNSKTKTILINGNQRELYNTNELLRKPKRNKWSKNRLHKQCRKVPCMLMQSRWNECNLCSTWSRH